MISEALMPPPPATRTARIRQVPQGQHHTVALKQGSRKVFLVCEDATVGQVREYYADQIGAPGVEQLDVAITARSGTKIYSPDEAASLLVTPDVRQIEFKTLAPAKG